MHRVGFADAFELPRDLERSAAGFVESASEWGDNVDIDHVFPRAGRGNPVAI